MAVFMDDWLASAGDGLQIFIHSILISTQYLPVFCVVKRSESMSSPGGGRPGDVQFIRAVRQQYRMVSLAKREQLFVLH